MQRRIKGDAEYLISGGAEHIGGEAENTSFQGVQRRIGGEVENTSFQGVQNKKGES